MVQYNHSSRFLSCQSLRQIFGQESFTRYDVDIEIRTRLRCRGSLSEKTKANEGGCQISFSTLAAGDASLRVTIHFRMTFGTVGENQEHFTLHFNDPSFVRYAHNETEVMIANYSS